MCALYQLGGCALKNAWIWPLPRWYKWFYGIPANNKMKPCCARMPAQNGINVSISLTNRFKWKPFPSGMLYVSGWFFFFLYLDRMQYIFNVLPDWVQTDIWSMWLLIFTLSTLPLNLWNFMLNVRNSKHTCDDAYGLFHMKFYLWPSPVAIQYGGIVWALNISKQSIKCVIIFFIPL